MVASFRSLLVPIADVPKPDLSWLSSLGDSIGGAIDRTREDRAFNDFADRIGGSAPAQAQQGGFLSRLMGTPQPSAQASLAAPQTASVIPVDRGQPQGSTFQPFIDTVKTKITNPYGLSAVAATGRAESGWSPQNAARSWSDPSQSGQAGQAGGILSWRAERLQNLQNYARSKGEQGNGTPQTQAEFFLAEDPTLIDRLNAAQSPQEAQGIMNNAWKFAGYNQPGGETARRMALAQNYYAQNFRDEQGQTAPASAPAAAPVARAAGNLVASLDPSAGIPLPGFTGAMRANDPGRVQEQPQQVAAAPQQAPAQVPVQQPAPVAAPSQVAQQGDNLIAAGVTPVQRGSVDPSLIQYMLRDRNLRQTGLQLWAANVQGQKASEPWQFVNLPDGTLARANQQTGAVERLGTFAKPQDPIKVGADDVLLDPVTKQPIYQGQGKSKAPAIVELFDEATGQPYKAQWNAETGQYDRVGGVKARSGMSLTTNPDGTVTLTEGAVGNMPKLTESEGRSTGFYGRALDSQKSLNDLEGEGTSLWNNTAGQLPKVGNFLRSEDAQKYDQAKRNFINAVLRRESGAVISPEEFTNADQQYFPQPGDGAEVIAQKRRNRETTIQGLKVSSGQGANFALPPEQQGQQPAKPGTRKTSTGVQWSIEE